MSNSFARQRPSSEQLVDLHVYLLPREVWNDKYRSSFNESIDEALSAGFVRVWPELTVNGLRMEIEEQLGHDILPYNYVFLRSVGRCMTQIKQNQELDLKCKAFLPPAAYLPEIVLLEAPPPHDGMYQSFDATQSMNGMPTNHDRMAPPGGPGGPLHHTPRREPHKGAGAGGGGGFPGHSGRPDAYSNEDSGISEEFDPDFDRRNRDIESHFNQLPSNHLQHGQRLNDTPQYQDTAGEGQKLADEQRREEQTRKDEMEVRERRRKEEERAAEDRRERAEAAEERKKQERRRKEEEEKKEQRRKEEEKSQQRKQEERRRSHEEKQKEEQMEREREIARQQRMKDEAEKAREIARQQQMKEEVERELEEDRQKKIRQRVHAERERAQELGDGEGDGTTPMETGPSGGHDDKYWSDAQLRKRAEHELRDYEPQSTWQQDAVHSRGRLEDEAHSRGGLQETPRSQGAPEGSTYSREGLEDGAHRRRGPPDIAHMAQPHASPTPSRQRRSPSDGQGGTRMDTEDAAEEAVQDGLKRVHLTPEIHRKAKIGKVKNTSTTNEEEDVYEVDPKIAGLLAQLQAVRQERLDKESAREAIVKKAKNLQAKTHDRRNKAFEEPQPRLFNVSPNKETHPRDCWKKRYFDEKKRTVPLEDEGVRLRSQLDAQHRKLMSHLEGKRGKGPSVKGPPSKKNDHKITIMKLQHEVDEIKRQVDNARMKLTSEMKLRNQAEEEVRGLKSEVTQRKINLTLTRNQKLAAIKKGQAKLFAPNPAAPVGNAPTPSSAKTF